MPTHRRTSPCSRSRSGEPLSVGGYGNTTTECHRGSTVDVLDAAERDVEGRPGPVAGGGTVVRQGHVPHEPLSPGVPGDGRSHHDDEPGRAFGEPCWQVGRDFADLPAVALGDPVPDVDRARLLLDKSHQLASTKKKVDTSEARASRALSLPKTAPPEQAAYPGWIRSARLGTARIPRASNGYVAVATLRHVAPPDS